MICIPSVLSLPPFSLSLYTTHIYLLTYLRTYTLLLCAHIALRAPQEADTVGVSLIFMDILVTVEVVVRRST